jgi:hypothetical protein
VENLSEIANLKRELVEKRLELSKAQKNEWEKEYRLQGCYTAWLL